MRSDAVITVRCDKCGFYVTEIQLTATAHGYDERYVNRELIDEGWDITGNRDICPDCQEEE